MNTPTHLALAVAVLGKRDRPKDTAWIIWGALLPDIPMYVLFVFDVARGVNMGEIFGTRYFQNYWQMPMNIVNSLPLYLLLIAIGLGLKKRGLVLLALAAIIHIVPDFFLHREDAHAHFWPFTNWKFISPVSYWDPNHYGGIFAPIEMVILLVSTYFGAKVFVHKWAKWLFVVVGLFIPLLYFGRQVMLAFGA